MNASWHDIHLNRRRFITHPHTANSVRATGQTGDSQRSAGTHYPITLVVDIDLHVVQIRLNHYAAVAKLRQVSRDLFPSIGTESEDQVIGEIAEFQRRLLSAASLRVRTHLTLHVRNQFVGRNDPISWIDVSFTLPSANEKIAEDPISARECRILKTLL